MNEYGLIGEKLGHSFSKEIHESISNYRYDLIELEKNQVESFFTKKTFKAINVTIPYKQTVIPFLDSIDQTAEKIGAVNTVVNRGGKLFGYNTDYFGLRDMLQRAGFDFTGKKVVILGTGGTSLTASSVIKDLGARELIKISSHKKPDYVDLHTLHKDIDFLINCTPVGMYPDNGRCLVDLKSFPFLKGVADVIYNPLRTKLLQDAEELGIKAVNGLYMLVSQAVYAMFLFNGKTDPEQHREEIVSIAEKTYRDMLLQKTNLVFTGMPSCGKSMFSRIIAKDLGRETVDTDREIVKRIGMGISDYFKKYGEARFRAIEKEVVAEVSKRSGIVIATGGGAILDKDNVRAMKQNGITVFLDRPLDMLKPTDSRPLSRDIEALKRRYDERIDVYRSTADVIVKNDKVSDEVARRILDGFEKNIKG